MSHVTRKSVFGGFDQVRHKHACSATETGVLKILDSASIGIILSRLHGCTGWAAPLLFVCGKTDFLMTWLKYDVEVWKLVDTKSNKDMQWNMVFWYLLMKWYFDICQWNGILISVNKMTVNILMCCFICHSQCVLCTEQIALLKNHSMTKPIKWSAPSGDLDEVGHSPSLHCALNG